MHRVTVSIDETQAEAFDGMIVRQGYQSRSEAVRDLIRQAVDEYRQQDQADAPCVASFSYVYDHHIRSLAQRLIEIGHEHHDMVVATTHIHLDHHTCLEMMMLKGPAVAVRGFAERIQAERGVRHGKINLILVTPNDEHSADGGHNHTGHGHHSPVP